MTRITIRTVPRATINPYTAMLGEGLARRGLASAGWSPWAPVPRDMRVLHLHWIETLAQTRLTRRSLAACRFVFARLERAIGVVQRRGGRVVWTAHNLRPHDAGDDPRSRALIAMIDRVVMRVDTVLAMSHASAAEVAAAWPGLAAKIRVVPHPHYIGVYPPGDGARFRHRHGIDAGARVLGMIGLIRRYKEHLAAIAAFRAHRDPRARLVIAGMCYDRALLAEIMAQAAPDPRIVVLPGALDDQDFADAMAACDCVLAAQRRFLNSGTVIAALSLGVPVLAAPNGTLTELQASVGADWLRLDPDLSARAIATALARPRPHRLPDLSAFAPDRVIDLHCAAYGLCPEADVTVRARPGLRFQRAG